MNPIIVRKFGGAGLSSIEKVKQVALSLKSAQQNGHKVIAVVSAMGNTTDHLISKAYEVCSRPDRRELDMLISTGERVSMSLLTMALKDLGCDAISFTGSQAGVLTNRSHSSAEILEVKPIRVEEALQQNKIVVVAGFQGVDPKTKEITTLGRGGTDTTAVAFASHFNVNQCEIIKEVDGIFTTDPNRIPEAKVISHINYSSLLHMCQWGAKALHYRCVEMAARLQTKIWVGSLNSKNKGTICSETGDGQGMNILEDLYPISGMNTPDIQSLLNSSFEANGWQLPSIMCVNKSLWLKSSKEIYHCVHEALKDHAAIKIGSYGHQCLTFSNVDTHKINVDCDLRENSGHGSHLFFASPLPDTSLRDIYRSIFTD